MRPLAVALLAVAAGLDAAPQQPPAFPARVEQVLVDAVVLDGRGRAVTGLTRDDFVVAEDGTAQTIDSFEAPDALPVAAKDARGTRGATASALAVVFDDLGLTYSQGTRARRALSAFARSRAASDLVLLSTTSGRERWPQPEAEAPASLAAVVDRLGGLDRRDSTSAPMTETEACLIHVAHDAPTLARVEARYRASGAGDALRAGVGRFVLSEATAACQRASAHARQVLAELARASARLAESPGRRSAVLVSAGFLHDEAPPELRRLLEASRRTNVTVYFLDASALEAAISTAGGPEAELGPADELRATTTSFGPAVAAGGRDADRAASAGGTYVAEETGGLVVRRTNDLAAGLGRIVGDSRARYVLGYVPTRPTGDVKYRTITVRLAPGEGSRRKAWTVRARRGYYPEAGGGRETVTPPQPVSPSPLPASTEAARASSTPDAGSLPIRLRAEALEDASDTPERVRCLLTVSVDLRRVSFREEAGRRIAHLDAAFEVSSDGAAEPSRLEKPVDLDFVPESRQMRDRWLQVQVDVPLGRGLHHVQASVRDAASGWTGAADLALDVPPTGVLRISERVLSDALETDDSGRTRARPGAPAAFAAGTTVFLSFDVFGSAGDPAASRPSVAVSGAVERPGAKKPFPATIEPLAPDGRGGLRGVIRFDLKDAAPGEYRFVGKVMEERGTRGIAFEEPFVVVPPERPATQAPIEPELASLLEKAGRYVVEYEEAFRNIVAEEEYVQRSPGAAMGLPDRRLTRADLVFVRLAGAIPWVSFRDVYEVDGAAVRDHTDRLERLFTERSESAIEKAEAILAESTRYNIGVERTINLPTLPLLFLHPRNQSRFAFEPHGKARPGQPVEVEFREVARPTFIRSRKPDSESERDGRGLDLPADGRFWIEPTRGTVVRSEVRLRTGWSEATATVTTRYRPEPRLAMWVPDEMKERYEIRASTGTGSFSYGPQGGGSLLETVARYTRLRRFEVTTDERARLPEP